MNRKFTSLMLLVLAFGVGIVTADYPALSAGNAPANSGVTLAIVLLLAVGVYGWYRIVKTTAEQQEWREREFRLSHRAVVIGSHGNGFNSER